MAGHNYNSRMLCRSKILLRWAIAGTLYYSGILRLYRIFYATRQPIILNYHRVLDPKAENENVSPGMYVRPQTFEKHLRYLTHHYQLVTMDQLVRIHEQGERFRRPICVITFDDGWSDNYKTALPLLRKYGLSATLFISTSFIGTGQTPWFHRLNDSLYRLASMPDDDARLQLKPGLNLPLALVRWLGSPRAARLRHIDVVIEELKGLPGKDLEGVVARVLQLLNEASSDNSNAMLSWKQVREMAGSGFEVGSHGLTHMILTKIPLEAAKMELERSKECIQEQLGQAITGFSYPNGDFSDEVEALIRSAGYRYACTTNPGSVDDFERVYRLKRISVHDDISFSTALFACHIAGVFNSITQHRRHTSASRAFKGMESDNDERIKVASE